MNRKLGEKPTRAKWIKRKRWMSLAGWCRSERVRARAQPAKAGPEVRARVGTAEEGGTNEVGEEVEAVIASEGETEHRAKRGKSAERKPYMSKWSNEGQKKSMRVLRLGRQSWVCNPSYPLPSVVVVVLVLDAVPIQLSALPCPSENALDLVLAHHGKEGQGHDLAIVRGAQLAQLAHLRKRILFPLVPNLLRLSVSPFPHPTPYPQPPLRIFRHPPPRPLRCPPSHHHRLHCQPCLHPPCLRQPRPLLSTSKPKCNKWLVIRTRSITMPTRSTLCSTHSRSTHLLCHNLQECNHCGTPRCNFCQCDSFEQIL